MNGWYPSINGRGEIASGFGEIFVTGVSHGVGWYPRWIDDDTIVCSVGAPGTLVLNVRTGQRTPVQPAYNAYAAGGGCWLGLWQGSSIMLDLRRLDGSLIRTRSGCGWPAMSPSGRYVFADRFHGSEHTVFLGVGKEPQPIYTGATMDLSVCASAVCIMEATAKYARRVIGIRDGQPAEDWSLFDVEWPLVCEGPDGPWVLSVVQNPDGLILRAAGGRVGYAFTGEYLNPAIRFVDGVFLIAASDSAGRLKTERVNPMGLRSALERPAPPGPPAPPTFPTEDPPMQKAEIDVDRFTLTPRVELPDGVVAEFHDRVNAIGAHVRLWVEGGSCRMSIDYPGAGPGLKGETGARRPVR